MATPSSAVDIEKYGEISAYNAPDWAKHLKVVPNSRVKLCMRPTPIHKWSPPNVPEGFEMSIKREDLAGSTLSGNKVRKLEFLLADALEKGCDTIITFGGLQSNHARATVVAARELGMETYVFALDFTADSKESTELSKRGNSLLMRLLGVNFVTFPFEKNLSLDEQVDHAHKEMAKFAEKLSAEGHKAYIVPKGGSNTLGSWAYLDCFYEMIQQGLQDDFDDIFVAAGSVGTICGLAIANYLTGSKLKIHAVSIYSPDTAFLYEHLDECLTELGLTDVSCKDLVNPVMDYIGQGYAHSTEEELDTIVDVMSHTGITLDPDFTVKSYRGMVGEMKKNPSNLKGKRILYIHTGGVYVLYDGRIDHVMQRRPECNKAIKSSELFS